MIYFRVDYWKENAVTNETFVCIINWNKFLHLQQFIESECTWNTFNKIAYVVFICFFLYLIQTISGLIFIFFVRNQLKSDVEKKNSEVEWKRLRQNRVCPLNIVCSFFCFLFVEFGAFSVFHCLIDCNIKWDEALAEEHRSVLGFFWQQFLL